MDKLLWFLWPSFPERVVDIIRSDGSLETYYDAEIRVTNEETGYIVSVRPRWARRDAPGVQVFISGDDPDAVSSLVSPFFIFSRRVLAWFLVWVILLFMAWQYFQGTVLAPPSITIRYGGRIIQIPDPDWSPDPVMVAAWILLIGFMFAYVFFNYMRFNLNTIKYVALMEVGMMEGLPYLVAAPKPLSTISPRSFLLHLGKKYLVYPIAGLVALAGKIMALEKANNVLREQALAYDDMLENTSGISKMIAASSASQSQFRMSSRTALLIIVTNLMTALVTALVVLAVTGGVVVQPGP